MLPPGPTKEEVRALNIKDVNVVNSLHQEYGDVVQVLPGLVFTRDPDHIRAVLGGAGVTTFPRPANVLANIKTVFNRAQIGLDGNDHEENKRMLSEWFFSTEQNAGLVVPFAVIAAQFSDRLGDESSSTGSVDVGTWAELAAADLSATISFGKSYNAVLHGKCSPLEAFKNIDVIFLGRASNRRWREEEPAETTELFETSVALLQGAFGSHLEAIDQANQANQPASTTSATKRLGNVLAHMRASNQKNVSSACPLGQMPTREEMMDNLTGIMRLYFTVLYT
jgi:hypothetical protein